MSNARCWITAPDGKVANVLMLPAGTVLSLPAGYAQSWTQPNAAPARPAVLTPREFRDALPTERQVQITAAAAANPGLQWLLLRLAAGEVQLDHPDTQSGVAMMLAAQVITAAEAAALLRA
jgi:hypothetical protein